MIRYTWLMIIVVLLGCDKEIVVSAPLLKDMESYLVQNRCKSDGGPPLGCGDSTEQKSSDLMLWRRMDWTPHNLQISDSVRSNRGYFITTWSYEPWGRFSEKNGDGGEVYVSDGRMVKIIATQDGSQAGVQRFSNWWLYNDRVKSGEWLMGDDFISRARKEIVVYPANGYGVDEIKAETIISEHYDLPGFKGKLERFYMGKNWGRLMWQRWEPKTRPVPGDLAARCPKTNWDGPSDINPDWVMYDCRLVTRLVKVDGSMSVDGFGWPGDGFRE